MKKKKKIIYKFLLVITLVISIFSIYGMNKTYAYDVPSFPPGNIDEVPFNDGQDDFIVYRIPFYVSDYSSITFSFDNTAFITFESYISYFRLFSSDGTYIDVLTDGIDYSKSFVIDLSNTVTIQLYLYVQEYYLDLYPSLTYDAFFHATVSSYVNVNNFYNNGYMAGVSDGIIQGYDNGYMTGVSDGIIQGYDSAYNAGLQFGYTDGKLYYFYDDNNDGIHDSFQDGYNLGLVGSNVPEGDRAILTFSGSILGAALSFVLHLFTAYDIFGINLLSIFLALTTLSLSFWILKKVL